MTPRVSVLVTTYNHAPYVEQALDSVAAQDASNIEVVITDDCSTDDSAQVIRRWLDRTGYPATFEVNERNLGICATRNRALARAHGEFVCSLSGDDWYESDRVSRQSAALTAQPPEVVAVYSDVRVVNADGSERLPSYLDDLLGDEPPAEGDVFRRLHQSCFLPAMAVMVRRHAIADVGGYDEALAFEDWDMWLRLADIGRFAYLPGVVANRRELATSLGHAGYRTPRLQRSVVRIMAKWAGRDEVARRQSAYWTRRAALVIAREDRQEARRVLHAVADVPAPAGGDDIPWRLVEAALALPGSGRLVEPSRSAWRRAAAVATAERGAWRAGRRIPTGRRQGRRALSSRRPPSHQAEEN